MINPNLVASLLTSGVLVALLGFAPATDAASGGRADVKYAQSARAYSLERRRRSRPLRIPLPVGPSYTYFDYPYYYSRGYYPTHIGGYFYYRGYRPTYVSRCADRQRRCAKGSNNRNHGACRCP